MKVQFHCQKGGWITLANSNLKEKELNSKFIKEQKEKIINHFKDFKELNYDIVNSFIDYIEIGEKNKKSNSQDVVIHWNF